MKCGLVDVIHKQSLPLPLIHYIDCTALISCSVPPPQIIGNPQMCFMSLILHQKRGNKHFTIFPSTDLILRNFVQYCCLASIIHHLLMSRIKDVPYLNYNCLQNILAKRIRPHYVFGPGGLRAPSAFHPLWGCSRRRNFSPPHILA